MEIGYSINSFEKTEVLKCCILLNENRTSLMLEVSEKCVLCVRRCNYINIKKEICWIKIGEKWWFKNVLIWLNFTEHVLLWISGQCAILSFFSLFHPFIWILVVTFTELVSSSSHCVCISCIICMYNQRNFSCVYDLPWKFTMYLEPKSHLVFHGVLADFLSVSFIKPEPSRLAVPIFCVRRRARPDGNCVKATSYLANCAS